MGETAVDDQVLLVESLGEVERVTLNRPSRLNALNQPLTDALLAYFEGLRRKADTRVVILRGAGRAFCSGTDLKASGTPEALRDGPNGDWVLRDMQKAMRACPQTWSWPAKARRSIPRSSPSGCRGRNWA